MKQREGWFFNIVTDYDDYVMMVAGGAVEVAKVAEEAAVQN